MRVSRRGSRATPCRCSSRTVSKSGQWKSPSQRNLRAAGSWNRIRAPGRQRRPGWPCGWVQAPLLLRGNDVPPPTMKQIAAELGVSVTTVSKVLNKAPDIGEVTRARVLAYIADH